MGSQPSAIENRVREVGPLAGAIGAYGMSVAFMNTTMSLFLADAVHVVPLMIGLFFAGRGMISIVVNLAAGSVSDRLSDRRVLIGLAGVCGALGGLCFALLRNYVALLVTGAVCFSISAVSFSQLFAYASEFALVRGRPVTRFTSALRSVNSASWVAGPPLGLYLAARYGFGPLYLATGGLLLATAVLGRWGLPRLPMRLPPGQAPGRAGPRPGHWALLALPRRTWLLLGAVIAFAVVNQIYSIDIALYVTKDLHLTAELVGWMGGLSAVLEVPAMIIAGRVADRLGKLRVTLCAAVAATAFFCLLPLARSAPALLALQPLNAAWVAITMSIPMIMVQQEAPGGIGGSSALYGSAFMSATMLAGSITGVTATAIGFGNVFWVCAALAIVAGGILAVRRSGD